MGCSPHNVVFLAAHRVTVSLTMVSDRQLVAGGLLAFASGAGSANTRARFGIFGASMSVRTLCNAPQPNT